jgi:hypothetical protein
VLAPAAGDEPEVVCVDAPAGGVLPGAAAVPCSPVFVDVDGACCSPADGFRGGRFGFALPAGAVWAEAPPAARLRAAARQSERSIRFYSRESARDAGE